MPALADSVVAAATEVSRAGPRAHARLPTPAVAGLQGLVLAKVGWAPPAGGSQVLGVPLGPPAVPGSTAA